MKKVLAAVLMVFACVAYAETDYTVERKVDYLWRHFVGSGGGGSVLQRLAEAEHGIHGIAGGLATNAEEIAQLETRIDGIATNYLPAWYRRSGPHAPWSPSWIVSEDVRFFGSVYAPELTQPLEDGIATNAAAIAAVSDSVDSLGLSVSGLSDEVSAVSEQATAVGDDLVSHIEATDNPHNVTLEQAATAGEDATYDYMRDYWGVEIDPSSGVTSLSGFGRTISFEEGYLDGEFDFRGRPTYGGIDLATVDADVSTFNNDAGYITSAALPTDVSDLNNDAGYATSNAVSEIARYIVNEMADDGWEVDGVRYKLVVEVIPPPPAETTLYIDGEAVVTNIVGNFPSTYKNNTGLTSVVIGTNVIQLGDSAFDGCTGLVDVTIPEGVTRIGMWAFRGCSNLTAITIPNSVTYIATAAFKGCTGLTDVTIPNQVSYVGSQAFYNCTNLAKVTVLGNITNDVTSYQSRPFQGCPSLATVVLGGNATEIADYMFYGCAGLTNVTVGYGVTNIGISAFSTCYGLTYVALPDSVTSISGNAFYGCTNITSLIIPDSVTSIGNSAFSWCPNLTSVTIGSGVVSIGSSAFSGGTGLTNVIIPSSVTSIGISAFYNCGSLMRVTMEGKTKYVVQTMSDYSWGLPHGCVITCSDGTLYIT